MRFLILTLVNTSISSPPASRLPTCTTISWTYPVVWPKAGIAISDDPEGTDGKEGLAFSTAVASGLVLS